MQTVLLHATLILLWSWIYTRVRTWSAILSTDCSFVHGILLLKTGIKELFYSRGVFPYNFWILSSVFLGWLHRVGRSVGRWTHCLETSLWTLTPVFPNLRFGVLSIVLKTDAAQDANCPKPTTLSNSGSCSQKSCKARTPRFGTAQPQQLGADQVQSGEICPTEAGWVPNPAGTGSPIPGPPHTPSSTGADERSSRADQITPAAADNDAHNDSDRLLQHRHEHEYEYESKLSRLYAVYNAGRDASTRGITSFTHVRSSYVFIQWVPFTPTEGLQTLLRLWRQILRLPLWCQCLWGMQGLFQTKCTEKHAVYMPPRQEMCYKQSHPKSLSVLSSPEVFWGRDVKRLCSKRP